MLLLASNSTWLRCGRLRNQDCSSWLFVWIYYMVHPFWLCTFLLSNHCQLLLCHMHPVRYRSLVFAMLLTQYYGVVWPWWITLYTLSNKLLITFGHYETSDNRSNGPFWPICSKAIIVSLQLKMFPLSTLQHEWIFNCECRYVLWWYYSMF